MNKLRVLDLFSGIGGFSLGLEMTGGFETVAFCEIEPFAQKVLRKHWPDVPIYDDVRSLDAARFGTVDCVTGGYPCQPFSLAGKRGGEKDDRHLWPEMHRLVASIRPRWVVAENVVGHIGMGLDQVLSDLEGEGYTCWPVVIPACAVDAPHRRDRVWIIAHTEQGSSGRRADKPVGRQEGRTPVGRHSEGDGRGDVPHTASARREEGERRTVQAPRDNTRRGRPERPGGGDGSGAVADADSQREPQPGGPVSDIGGWLGNGGEQGVVADADSERRNGCAAKHRKNGREKSQGSGNAPAPHSNYVQGQQPGGDAPDNGRGSGEGQGSGISGSTAPTRWLSEPDVGRVAHGIPRRVDRLKGLGNAVVPQVVAMIGHAILEAENDI